MSLILDGSTGVSDVDGSAATPAIRGTDANTGMFFPAADTIAFSEGGTEVMRITSAGNMGLGTTTPTEKLELFSSGTVYGKVRTTSGGAGIIFQRDNSATTQWLVGHGAASANANFEIFTAGAGDFNIQTNGSERMRVVGSTGNVCIGTTSSSVKLNVKGGNGDQLTIDNAGETFTQLRFANNGANKADFYFNNSDSSFTIRNIANGIMSFETNATERMRIDNTGNVGIGTSSPAYKLDVVVTGTGEQNIISARTTGGGGQGLLLGVNTTNTVTTIRNNTGSGYGMAFYSGGGSTESMRITSAGQLLVGTTSWNGGGTIGLQINATNNTSNQYAQLIKNSNNAEIIQLRCDGGIANFSANNSNLSDERTKTDIKLANSYLGKICAIPVKTFKYKDQTDDLLNLGVIAQDVEAVAPELVDVGGFGETPEDGIPLKAIYQTDLQYALMKAIQELKAELDSVKAELQTLKGN